MGAIRSGFPDLQLHNLSLQVPPQAFLPLPCPRSWSLLAISEGNSLIAPN